MKKNVKKIIIPSVYLVAILSVLGCVYLTIATVNSYFDKKENFNYAIDGMENTPIKPVQAEDVKEETDDQTIIKPYKSEKVSVGRYFYDYESDEQKQENSIILYENTYMQNTGVDYISDEAFEVVSVLPGTISSIEDDEILGKIVKIQHDKDILTVYEGIDNINLKIGDKVTSGQTIATSGTSNINANYKNSLHFEVYYKGSIMDPENFYTLNLKEL